MKNDYQRGFMAGLQRGLHMLDEMHPPRAPRVNGITKAKPMPKAKAAAKPMPMRTTTPVQRQQWRDGQRARRARMKEIRA